MARSDIEAPADGEYGTVSEWRRSPAQPVTLLIGSTNPFLPPARPKPAKSDTEAFVRCRSGHDKAKPQSGRISALAGREGRLRACYTELSSETTHSGTEPWLQHPSLKATLFRAFGPGRPRFSVVGMGCDGSGMHGSRLCVNILDVVTIDL
ncbi:hypothetical protein RN004_003849 [Salmonella enterica]|nr:hypothetical protein [Salmonella enterica]